MQGKPLDGQPPDGVIALLGICHKTVTFSRKQPDYLLGTAHVTREEPHGYKFT